ncbi:MAG TPA: prepilin-type N-terminal cleavage/methylation domain-containing protein [Solirubrobacteraceae bacterium]|jgi:Tfp pilus assembly protein PilW|nr:prepilin-type N-terminal cleavage/methylation domain-containing protein [Solirubrobacteraceae bacterium]
MLTKRFHSTPAQRETRPHLREARPSLSDESGFTLIELLVALVTGMVIILALVAVLAVATRDETHLTNVAQATQLGRLAMTKIVDELHSACIAPGFTPIQANSTGTELRFVNSYGKEAVISKAEVNEHRIVWNEKAETLTDFTYPASKEEIWPKFKYSETANSTNGVLIASHVTQMESEGKKLPIFQYYSYDLESNESTTTGVNMLNTAPLKTPLEEGSEGAATAAAAAAVLISFNTGSATTTTSLANTLGKTLSKDVSDGQQTQVTLSFSVPISEAEKVDTPCQ